MSHSAHLPGVLAIDAGNSKTDLALVGADGTVLATARGGGFQPQHTGPEAAVAALAPLVDDLARQVGVEPRPDGRPLTDHVSACLANADLPIEEQQLHEAISGHGWGASAHVANDTFGLLRAGTDGPLGVAVVCGAGINCVGLRPDGRTARWPALGQLTGDWGGGGGLAAEAMWHAARAEDGRGPATLLSPMIGAHFGLVGANAFAEAMHLGRIDRARLHEVAQVLFAAGTAGDPVALDLIDRQADEVARLAVIALTRLDLLDRPVPVVLGGGVLASRQPLLLDNLTARLAADAPLAEPRVVVAPPVLGAALLGLDHLDADPAAHRRLRDGYPTAHPIAA
ncbi:N-acetylglucosamine kinase [Kitasatospora fiedleri]|uniref:N-acetylglucosamine kinase n=1 Tax=Kitasatospora fiedleri TaxID=2991545 RepID=UPI00249BA732|nr:BadF/BadG/BcrA/BcrD ATPase family protein [Kitasatospora fiedleri]